jgi:hypothetical protein
MKKDILFLAMYTILCVAIVSSCEKESKNLPVQPGNSVTVPPPAITIGQSYGGGIVFYVDSTGRHGLVMAKISSGQAIPWSNGSSVITNAVGVSVGWGRENTSVIVGAQGPGNYAASICDKLIINGYDDWFLPSKEELYLLYQQKTAGKLNGLSDDFYWSSTEASESGAWSQSFSNGANSSADKQGSYTVRAIRAF